MCEKCKRQHHEAMVIANEHMDAEGVPEDSVLRGLADIQLACNAFPILSVMMQTCYPSMETLLESPALRKSDI